LGQVVLVLLEPRTMVAAVAADLLWASLMWFPDKLFQRSQLVLVVPLRLAETTATLVARHPSAL
jgi:hypothetical protein